MTWLSTFLLQLVEWGLPLLVTDVEQWWTKYQAKRQQKQEDAKSSSDFQKVVDNKQSTEQERKDAENTALNS